MSEEAQSKQSKQKLQIRSSYLKLLPLSRQPSRSKPRLSRKVNNKK